MKKCSLLAFVSLLLVDSLAAEELRLNARTLIDQSVTRNVCLSADRSAIEIERGVLCEDDGPAAGYSYQRNEERISDRVWIRKELVISNPMAKSATLLVAPGGDLDAIINGNKVVLKGAGKVGGYWHSYSLPPDALKAGKNDIVLRGSGKVWIARAEDFATGSANRKHPNRSARSSDGGKTWNCDQLGPNGDIDGEYYVRVFLDQYRASGWLMMPVIDIANLHGKPIAPPVAVLGAVRVRLEHESNAAAPITLKIRSGTTPTPDAKSWTKWQTVDAAGELREPKGRYLQVMVALSTAEPWRTPRLKGLVLEATAQLGADWTATVKPVEFQNERIVRSSVPFAYEPFDHPRLKLLRSKYKLDKVVQGAANEWELITRLARWSAQQWRRGHLKDGYPAWDALEILQPHADGTPIGGFCQQYNLVFLQACESFGIPGRAVSIGVGDHGGAIRGGGHEIVELWSNQFNKWVYVDGNFAWYAVDEKTGVPLSLWELRERQLQVIAGKQHPPVRIIQRIDGPKRWTGLNAWPPFLELRLIPRSNFLQQKSPLPLNQGMRGWFWTGHHAWSDSEYPASLLYGERISHRQNWEWTLNQAHLTLVAEETGVLRVFLDTETPGFDTFLAEIDGKAPSPVSSSFHWKLHKGRNQLVIRPRNTAGRSGLPSRVVLDYP